jgi:Calx-beta domain
MSFWRNGMGKSRANGTSLRKKGKRRRAQTFKCDSLERRRLFATVSWVTNGNGNWSTGSNWSTGTPPAAGDNVVIDIPGLNVTVTYSGGATLPLNNLLNNELLVISGAGGVSWTGGTWDGSGIVEIDSSLSISGSADKIMKDGQTLQNLGTTTVTGTGNIVGQVGATIENDGTFDVRSDMEITFPAGVGDGVFNNNGIFTKSIGGTAPGDMTEIGGDQGFTFNNNGDCQVLQGTLGLGDNQNASLSVGGTFEVSAGATLEYLRGVNNIVVDHLPGVDIVPSITGAGTTPGTVPTTMVGRVLIAGGTEQMFGNFAVHTLDVEAGSFLLQQNMQELAATSQRNTIPNLTTSGYSDILDINGGTFGGNGAGIFPNVAPPPKDFELPGMIVRNTFSWTAGTLSGTGRLLLDTTTTSATITTTAPKSIVGGYGVDILDEVLLQDSGTIDVMDNSAIWIHESGTLWDQGDETITGDGSTGYLWNSGNFLKLDGTGTTTIDTGISFINDSLWLGSESLQAPNETIPPPLYLTPLSPLVAQLDIRTGTVQFNDNTTNYDDYSIKPGATLSLQGGTAINGVNNNLTVTAKILGVEVGGVVGGTIDFGNVNFTGDTRARLDVGQTNFDGGTYLFNNLAGGAQVVHTGTFSSGTIGGNGAIEVENSLDWIGGTFDGVGGTTSFLQIDPGAVVTIPSGDRTTLASYSILNEGTIQWTTSPGSLDINGNYTQTSTGIFVCNFEPGSALVDELVVTGNVTVDGTLTLNINNAQPTDGEQFTVISNGGTNPITGAFVGLPEGSTITLGSTKFTVTYMGGADERDMVLTAVVLPVITIATPAPVLESSLAATSLQFVVSLSQAVMHTVTVQYTTTDGTAKAGVDYTTTTGTLTIPAGQSSAMITVPILADTAEKPTVTFTLTLSNPTLSSLGTPLSAVGTILNSNGPPVLTFGNAPYTVADNAGVITITVLRGSNPLVPVTVDYSTTPGTAIAGVNYTAVTGTLVFASGVKSVTFQVPIINDLVYDGSATSNGDLTFNVNLSNPQGGGAFIGSPSTTVTVTETTLPSITMSGGSVVEGTSGTTDLPFTLTLQPTVNTVTVDYTTVDGTATAGQDYTAGSGTVTFAPGQTTQTVDVSVIGSTVVKPTETVLLELFNATNATISQLSTTGTILNDNVPSISIGNVTVTEPISGIVNAVFPLTLSTAAFSPLSVTYGTVDGTAIAGSDYTAESGTVTIPAGQTTGQISIPVNTDFLQEDTETFSVALSNPVGVTLANNTATGSILNQLVHSVTLDAKHPFRYIDANNTRAMVSLKGPGSGSILYLGQPNNDVKEIFLDGTTARSQLIVNTVRLQTYLVNLTVNGTIGAVVGPQLDLQGDINISGAVRTLRLHSILGGNTINIGSGDGSIKGVVTSFADVNDLTLNSALPLTTVSAAGWHNSSGTGITAPSVGTIASRGNFQANVNVTGNLGSLNVAGSLNDSIIRVGGNINQVAARLMTNDTIFAGVDDSVTTLPDSAAQFVNSTSTIKRVIITSGVLGAFSNTLVAAPIITAAQTNSVSVANNGASFGFAGDIIRSVKGRGDQAINQTQAKLMTSPFSDLDFEIRLTT